MIEEELVATLSVKNSTVAANDFAAGGEGKRREQRRAKFLIYKWSGSGYRTKPWCALMHS